MCEIAVSEYGWVAWSFFKLTYLLLLTCQTTYLSVIDQLQYQARAMGGGKVKFHRNPELNL